MICFIEFSERELMYNDTKANQQGE